jgi:hypothetical protein
MIASGNAYALSLVISRALLTHNRGRKPGLADGIVVTPSHHPSQDRGFNASWCESWVLPASRPSQCPAAAVSPHPGFCSHQCESRCRRVVPECLTSAFG